MKVNDLKELLAAATPTPWVEEDASLVNRGVSDEYDPVERDFDKQPSWDIGQIYAPQNRALIVAAVNALPALLARVEALERVAQDLVAGHEVDDAKEGGMLVGCAYHAAVSYLNNRPHDGA